MNAPETTTKRHPIRGAIYGLCLGIGVAIYLIIFSIVEFNATTAIIVVVVCIVIGILWGLFAPAKKPKGAPPATIEHEAVPTMADAGFDTAVDDGPPASGLGPPPSLSDPAASGLAPPPSPPGGTPEGGPEDPI